MADEINNYNNYNDENNDAANAQNTAPNGEQATSSTEQGSYMSGEYAGAGVGEKFTVENHGSTSTQQGENEAYTQAPHNDGYTYRSSANEAYTEPQKVKKEKKKKRERKGIGAGGIAILLVVCILLSAGAGFGGAALYGSFSSKSGNSVVVNRVESKGNVSSEDGSLADITSQIADTVVEIRTEAVVNGSFFGNYVSEGAGSGVIISSDGYIITNNHVISGADTITVTTKDGTEYDAKLVATDSQSDIAVIKIDASDLNTAIIGSSADLVVGERAIAIGNPLGELGGTVTFGYISALDREVTIDGTTMTLLQTDAAINPGNSGGGLFNTNGELIGIVNAKSSGDSIEGLGFAIPIDTAYTIAQDLIENGYVSGRPALGISVVEITESNYYQYRTSELGPYIDNFGVYIAADDNGNFSFGDRIIAIEGTSVSSRSEILEILSSQYQVGDTIKVTVSRDRKLVEIEVTLFELSE
jgi:serine protease Do